MMAAFICRSPQGHPIEFWRVFNNLLKKPVVNTNIAFVLSDFKIQYRSNISLAHNLKDTVTGFKEKSSKVTNSLLLIEGYR